MDPEKTLMAGAVSVLIYLDICLITLGISVTDKLLCHKLIYLFADFWHKYIYPVNDGLLYQEDPLHLVIGI